MSSSEVELTTDTPAAVLPDTPAPLSFAELGLSPTLLQAVTDQGYSSPTPIQAQAIPVVLKSRDVLGCAQTGTGKTASFTLPMIDLLAKGRARARMPRSLILEPTRELATQVADNFIKYGKYHKLNMALLIGGETMNEQISKLDRGVDVLIATPGRLMDLFERGKMLLTDIRIFVIDEADRMLDMGFIPDIEKIAGFLPRQRQTLFFSATMPPEIRKLADKFLTLPAEITVSRPATTATTVAQHVITLDGRRKREALRLLLKQEQVESAFIFCNRKRDVDILNKSLQQHGFSAAALHGDMVQSARTATLEAFRAGRVQLLVCSDVAARGIDISDVGHVFNFDVPFHAEDYVHRIGRTGRAGRTGKAFMLATSDDDKLVAAIEELIKQPIPPMALNLGDAPPPAAKEARPPLRHKTRAHSSDKDMRARGRGGKPVPFDDSALDHDDDSAVGFGDHLPAFLRRAPVLRPQSETDDIGSGLEDTDIDQPHDTPSNPTGSDS